MGALQDAIKQRRPFRSRGHEAVVGLVLTVDRLRRELAPVVAARGLTLQQYNVLRILRGAGPEGLPTLEVGERMIEQAPGVTRLLDRLERKKLVTRGRSLRDRRRVLVAISPTGLRVLAGLDEPVARSDRKLEARLGPRRTTELIRLLEALRDQPEPLEPETKKKEKKR